MFLSAIHFFNVLAIVDLLLIILCCFLIIKLPLKYGIKFLVIPLIALTSYILIIQGADALGRPYEVMPVGEFEFIDYRVIANNGPKKIELWVVQNKKSRLHVIDYTPSRESELAKSKSRKDQGSREKGRFTDGGGNNIADSDLAMSSIKIENILPPK